MSYAFHIIGREDGSAYLTVFIPGQNPLTVASDHPNYDAVLEAVKAGDSAEHVTGLADIPTGVARRFERITERVIVRDGHVYFDNDEVDDSVADAIIRAMETDDDSSVYSALALFMEKVAANPQPHSREQLYTWLAAHQFTITPDGDIVGYKGMREQDAGTFTPTNNGPLIVNGVETSSYETPQEFGDIVELPRSAVDHDPGSSCSTGLHVGTFNYASKFGDTCLLVTVSPTDVVSVPTGAGGDKVRVCRYRLLAHATGAVDTVVLPETPTEEEEPASDGPARADYPEQCYYCEEDDPEGIDADGDVCHRECNVTREFTAFID